MKRSQTQKLIKAAYENCHKTGGNELSLSGIGLKSIPDDIGRNFPNLQVLYIQDNNLTKLENLEQLNRLTRLIGYSNKLRSIGNITALPNLKRLNLSDNKIKKIPALDKLIHLKRVDLSYNRIDDITKLLSSEKIEELDLRHNKIEIIPEEVLATELSVFLEKPDTQTGIYLQGNPLDAPLSKSIKKSHKAFENYFISKREKPKMFISYSRKDKVYKDEFKKRFSRFNIGKRFDITDDQDILPGEKWEDKISESMDDAKFILLFLSNNFFKSDFIQNVELEKALEQYDTQKALLVPIILGKCNWQNTRLSEIQVTPFEGKPIKHAEDQGKAWTQVIRDIEKLTGNTLNFPQ